MRPDSHVSFRVWNYLPIWSEPNRYPNVDEVLRDDSIKCNLCIEGKIVAVKSLNHAVLFVSNVELSAEFYCTVLGFQRIPADFPGGAFLRGTHSANDHDLGLFTATSPRGSDGAVGLYHLAWEVETLGELALCRERMIAAGALTGTANHAATKALYGRDPDGIEFEITWLVPDGLLDGELVPGVEHTRPLDIAAEIDRYGRSTAGGPRADRAIYAQIAARLGHEAG